MQPGLAGGIEFADPAALEHTASYMASLTDPVSTPNADPAASPAVDPPTALEPESTPSAPPLQSTEPAEYPTVHRCQQRGRHRSSSVSKWRRLVTHWGI
jgi:hypothetical protein